MEEPQDRSVYVSVPPRTEFLALLRTVTGGVATRVKLPIDAIDDLRLAVDEAAVFLLTIDRSATRVGMRLDPTDTALTVTIGMDSSIERWPPDGYEGTLPWQVISGLTDDATATRSGEGIPQIRFTKRTVDERSA